MRRHHCLKKRPSGLIYDLGKMNWYKRVIKNCCIPGCNGFASNVHHICPLGKGGIDEIKNYFAICLDHHFQKGMHCRWERNQIELLTWKYFQELTLFGFTSNDFPDNEFMAKVGAQLTILTKK